MECKAKEITAVTVAVIIAVLVNGSSAGPVLYQTGHHTVHSSTNHATSNAYIVRKRNPDVISHRFPKTFSAAIFPSHAKILQIQQSLIKAPVVAQAPVQSSQQLSSYLSYSPVAAISNTPTETRSILSEDITGLKLFLSPPSALAPSAQILGSYGKYRNLEDESAAKLYSQIVSSPPKITLASSSPSADKPLEVIPNGNGSVLDEIKLPEDQAVKTEVSQLAPDVSLLDASLISNLETKQSNSTTEKLTNPSFAGFGNNQRPDLLDLLEEIKNLERKREEEKEMKIQKVPEVVSGMQNRQDFGIEQPSPFNTPNFNQSPQQTQPESYPFEDNQTTFPQPQPPAPPQQPQFLPSPPQPPSQFQSNEFFPAHNRFQIPQNNPHQPFPQGQPPQFNPFQPQHPQQGAPPRNIFGGGPPPEPENGYNPYHMFEQFPEPPYESEFAKDQQQLDYSGGESVESRSRFPSDEVESPPPDFTQSTLRGIKTEELLQVVERKPVPPNCNYNTISYGPNGEDCVERKKRSSLR